MFSSNTSQVADDKLFVEDCFSTYLYNGNSTARSIVNGVDLAGKGGMVWIKTRTQGSAGWNHVLFDTARGANKIIYSNADSAQNTSFSDTLTGFNSDGFSLGADASTYWVNQTGYGGYASWTFRKAPKFFDVVTYTGNGANRNIAHNLGVAPGCILVKRTDTTADWQVYHRSNANTEYMVLNSTAAKATGTTRWNSTTPTATEFTVGTDTTVNANGGTYVAYLFAHDATSDGIIQCGSFTTDASKNIVGGAINLGWEPQWFLIKRTDTTGSWITVDNMRGWGSGTANSAFLFPDTSGAEDAGGDRMNFTPNGLGASGYPSASATYIYIAIRRGPMRIPTSGTSVFAPVSQAGGGTITTNFPVDLVLTAQNTLVGDKYSLDRLRGSVSTSSKYLITNKTDAEATVGAGFGLDNNVGYKDNGIFSPSYNAIYWNFRRAPSFFDGVCYTGTGSVQNVKHNLGVVPELIIVKNRANVTYGDWMVYHKDVGVSGFFYLNLNSAVGSTSSWWNQTSPTSTQFTTSNGSPQSNNGITFVAYLFASCPGVSKVGSYTGNGSSQTINCGFAAGARFVLIKRTDSTGDWYVWDTARGIVAGNDPHLSLNGTAAEVTTDDSIDTDSSGFVVNQVAATNINVSSATYIYLAVA